ncbi:hypothetical protein NQ315_010262 [Exocentrus adspersus]|uniref:Uncharacterized protein n=1 Tax=Exocentrus adspersus TaxID=1586481 RepID=A0AAV8WDA5_9CUCU|nr:hypothetical protein NQ315_010262 [Exocentrus adspersus]
MFRANLQGTVHNTITQVPHSLRHGYLQLSFGEYFSTSRSRSIEFGFNRATTRRMQSKTTYPQALLEILDGLGGQSDGGAMIYDLSSSAPP